MLYVSVRLQVLIIVPIQVHTIDMGSHQNIFEELLAQVLIENEETTIPETCAENIFVESSSMIDAPKIARDVHDIVTEYLKTKAISINDLVTVTPFWPTKHSLDPKVLSPLSPVHPQRPCSLDFIQHNDIFQLIGVSMLIEFISISEDGMQQHINQALKLLNSENSKLAAPLKTTVSYVMDPTKSTSVPALVKFSYVAKTSDAPPVSTIDLTEGNGDDLLLTSSSKKVKIGRKKMESGTNVRKSHRSRQKTSNSYERRFVTDGVNTEAKQGKHKPPVLVLKKQSERSSKKQKSAIVQYDNYNDDNYCAGKPFLKSHYSYNSNPIVSDIQDNFEYCTQNDHVPKSASLPTSSSSLISTEVSFKNTHIQYVINLVCLLQFRNMRLNYSNKS